MTKAERIYNKTRLECKKHIEAWGYEQGSGFNTVIYSDEDTVCKRTLNDIAVCLERAKKNLAIDIKLGILTAKEAEFEAQVLSMVENTIKNTIR